MYQVSCQGNRVTIIKGKGSLSTLAKAKTIACEYVDAYKQAPRNQYLWAKQAIRTATLSEFNKNEEGVLLWKSPDF